MKVIINADDFGLTRSVNDAIFELAQKGTITSTTVMTNMPFAEEAVELLPNKNISIGLHVTLTQGKPVSDPERIVSLVDKNGNFYPPAVLKNLINGGKVKNEDLYT